MRAVALNRRAHEHPSMSSNPSTEATVYRFTWWDRHDAREVVSPRFATSQAIARCEGKPIEYARLLVNSSEVDYMGFWRPRRSTDPRMSASRQQQYRRACDAT
jgi:hypothetical protein